VSFFNELLNRKVPQILGSYLIASITLIGALDWLASRYELSDTYVSIAIFCLISISPSVMLLAYFHGTPGKDEWVKVEKFGIPLNILFIACFLMLSNNFDLLEPTVIDNIDDNFLVFVTSNNQSIENTKKTDEWAEIVNQVADYGILEDQKLNKIRKYIYSGLRQKLLNYDVSVHFAATKEENKMLEAIFSFDYMLHTKKNKLLDENKVNNNNVLEIFDHFNEKLSTKIDKVLKIDLLWFSPIEEDHLKVITNDYLGLNESTNIKGERSLIFFYKTLQFHDVDVVENDNIEYSILEALYNIIIEFRFGESIGIIENVLNANLVTIKLKNLNILKGTHLKMPKRNYSFTHNTINENLTKYIDDFISIKDDLNQNPIHVSKYYHLYDNDNKELLENNPDSVITIYIDEWNYLIDSLNTNFDTIVNRFIDDKSLWERLDHIEFSYELEILNVQDSIATAKINKFSFPFVKPQIGDEVRLKE